MHLYGRDEATGEDFWFEVVGWDRPAGMVLKAQETPQPGDRWITVHPNGPGSKGTPILVRPVKGEKGGHRVVGGAGGKLNFLHIQNVKDPATYKEEARARAAESAKKRQEERAAMSPEERAAAKQEKAQAQSDRTHAEQKFIEAVLGPQAATQPSLLDEPEDPKEAKAKHRELLRAAHEKVQAAEKKLILDPDVQKAAGLQIIDPKQVPGFSIDELVKPKADFSGPGYQQDVAARAEANGLTAEKLMGAVQAIKEAKGGPPKPPVPGQEAQGAAAGVTEQGSAAAIEATKQAKQLQAAQAASVREAIKDIVVKNEALAGVLQARAELRQLYKAQAQKERGRVFEPGYQIATSAPNLDAIVDDLEDKYLRQHVAAFLDEVEDAHGPTANLMTNDSAGEEGLHAIRGAAAWDSLNEVGLSLIGQGILDRDTVEVLGPEGAAQVMARALRNLYTPEDQKDIVAALEEHHVDEQKKLLPEATSEAQRLRAEASKVALDLAETPKDLAVAAEMQKGKVELLKDARRTLGRALGRLEARAALINALKSTPPGNLTVPMGFLSPERAVQTAAALGLKEGQFSIEHEKGEGVLTMSPEAMDSLIRPVDHAAVAEREAAMSIKRGQMDEKGWLPQGFARRTEDRYANQLQEQPTFARHLSITPEAGEGGAKAAVQDHIASRFADGERPEDIARDLTSATALQAVPEHLRPAFTAEVNRIFPPTVQELDKAGNPIPLLDKQTGKPIIDPKGNVVFRTRPRGASESVPMLQEMTGSWLDSQGISKDLAMHTQAVDFDSPDWREAVHRTLAEDPRHRAAFLGTGELAHDHQTALRDYFYDRIAKTSPKLKDQQAEAQAAATEALGPEPQRFSTEEGGSLFAEMGMDPVETPEWSAWNAQKQAIEAAAKGQQTTAWEEYVHAHGGLRGAQEAIQDTMKSEFLQRLHGHYAKLTGRQLKVGALPIRGREAHLKTYGSPEEQAAAKLGSVALDSMLRNKNRTTGGKFGSGSIADKREEAAAQAKAAEQQQASLFGDAELSETSQPEQDTKAEPKAVFPDLDSGERFTLGHVLENQIHAMMPAASAAFDGVNQGVDIREGTRMDGRFVNQQRAVKAIGSLKRMGLFYGAGSGKTGIMLGGLTQGIKSGQMTKCIMAVPSVVQAQFNGEAIRYIDPESGINVHAKPGETFEERLQAYKDPTKHAVVVTHQSLRDDTIKLLAKHQGMDEEDVPAWMHGQSKADLAAAVKAAFQAEGINHNALMVDEGHDALNRKGKPDSTLARAIDAHGHAADFYVGATGSPVKNDPSEAFDWLHKIDPQRYPAEARDEFLRQHGVDSASTRRSLKLALTRYFFADRVHPGIGAAMRDHMVTLTPKQQDALLDVDRAAAKLRTGDGDMVQWAKQLAPAAFEGAPEEAHAQIADSVRKAVGTHRDTAYSRIIDMDPEGAKIQAHIALAKDAVASGKPLVIFAHRLDAVDQIHKALGDAGIKVASLTGRDSSADKAKKKALFQPEDYQEKVGTDGKLQISGSKPQVDVLVLSDAAATGLNLQRGKILVHHDQPMTYKTWEQRSARINRLGQTQDVEIVNMMSNHRHDVEARERVRRKEALASIYQSPAGYLDDTGIAEKLATIKARNSQTKTAA